MVVAVLVAAVVVHVVAAVVFVVVADGIVVEEEPWTLAVLAVMELALMNELYNSHFQLVHYYTVHFIKLLIE